jgi:hypothetical protein
MVGNCIKYQYVDISNTEAKLRFEISPSVSGSVRLPFLFDPFGVWFVPIPMIHVFFSMSWPLHVAVAILVIFFWMELVASRNIKTSAGFLTTKKWPAAIVIILVILAEYTTAGMRAAGLTSAISNINAAFYLLVLLFCIIVYIYTYYRVLSFFKSSLVLRSQDRKLRQVSLRFLLAAVTFILLIITAVLIITPYYNTAAGQSIIHFAVYMWLNIGSACTISAFLGKPGVRRDSQVSSVDARSLGESQSAR